MIPKEVLRKIKRIQITTSRKVTDVFAGRYQSVFKGSGIEFDEVREYLPGDEIRSIDWNVTARTGHPFIKKFVEERQLTIMILLDVSMSCRFGTRNRMKSDMAAEFCSVLAFSAIQNNDKVGMITFSDRVEKFIPPRKGVRHVLRVVREGLHNKPVGMKTDINQILEYLNKVKTRSTVTFIVSDFFAPDFKQKLSITNKRHDVIAVTINDPAERDLPDTGIVKMHDAETNKPYLIDTSNKKVRQKYRDNAKRLIAEREHILKTANVDCINIFTDESYVDPLIRFFKLRERRLRKG